MSNAKERDREGQGKRKVEEQERTNGRRREGHEKRKGEEEKREQQLLQVAESTWGL